MSDQEGPIRKKKLPSYGDLIAFHLPIILIGGLVLMPIIYSVLSNFGLLGEEFSELISSYSTGKLIIFSIASLLPSMIAYGRDLQFNLWRFLVSLAIVAIMILQTYAQLKAAVPLPLPFGGGLLGVLIATVLGWVGIRVRKNISLKKIGLYALFGLATFI